MRFFFFGSYAKKRTDYGDIDIDFLRSDSMNEISVSARSDDMDGDPRFDISCLNSMGTMIKQEVLENGTILLSKDANAVYGFSERTIKGVFRL